MSGLAADDTLDYKVLLNILARVKPGEVADGVDEAGIAGAAT